MKNILMVGRLSAEGYDWTLSPLPQEEEQPVDGELQRSIDEAQMTMDYAEDILDREFFSRGNW